MTYNIAISNRVNERLVALKGDGSYSAAIESLLNKCEPVHPSAKMNEQAPAPSKEPACQDSHSNI